jgi:hypothetical protein
MNPGFISNGHLWLWIVIPVDQGVIMLTDSIRSILKTYEFLQSKTAL